jgi:hypothetical protein
MSPKEGRQELIDTSKVRAAGRDAEVDGKATTCDGDETVKAILAMGFRISKK